jgi:hypothetical protein
MELIVYEVRDADTWELIEVFHSADKARRYAKKYGYRVNIAKYSGDPNDDQV